tara:strand:+ start:502 stop:1344 length:843 start_codon:yes stop_codon:yes gene_type:complete
MKKIKNPNLINSMYTKTILKNLFKFSLGLTLISPLIKNEPAQALTACADTNTVADLSGEADPCFLAPEMLKVRFYEIGFCTSDPLATGTFVNTTCQKSWDNTSGFETDIGKKSFETMNGTTYQVNNSTYSHAYAIMNNKWTYKAKYKFQGGDTFYTASGGAATNIAGNYVEWEDDISDLLGEETTGLCYDYTASTSGGTVTALLTNTSLVTATDSTTCNNATRLVGSAALSSSLTMDESVKGYKLEWKITGMGIGITKNASDLPGGWRGGPFTPIFTLIK